MLPTLFQRKPVSFFQVILTFLIKVLISATFGILARHLFSRNQFRCGAYSSVTFIWMITVFTMAFSLSRMVGGLHFIFCKFLLTYLYSDFFNYTLIEEVTVNWPMQDMVFAHSLDFSGSFSMFFCQILFIWVNF